MKLDNNARERYLRHLTLPGFGLKSQKKLMESSVLIIGMGGLGCPASTYLAAAGVGTLGLMDDDLVSLSNLQRQVLYSEDDIGKPKTHVAKKRLRKLNPGIHVKELNYKITPENALEVFSSYHVIIDATDNFNARYLINDASFLSGKPYVYGSVFRFEGQLAVFGMKKGPCYRCIFPDFPPDDAIPDCSAGGVLGVIPGIIGAFQALEAIKILSGQQPSESCLLQVDGAGLEIKKLRMSRDNECRLCGDSPEITQLRPEQAVSPAEAGTLVSASELLSKWTSNIDSGWMLLDVRSKDEWNVFNIGGTHLPLQDIDSLDVETFRSGERSSKIVVVCETGKRSLKAAQQLRQKGLPAVSLDKGLQGIRGEVIPGVEV